MMARRGEAVWRVPHNEPRPFGRKPLAQTAESGFANQLADCDVAGAVRLAFRHRLVRLLPGLHPVAELRDNAFISFRRHFGHRPRHRARAGGRRLRDAACGARPRRLEREARDIRAHRRGRDPALRRRATGRWRRLAARCARPPARGGGLRRRAAWRPDGEPARHRGRGAGDADQLRLRPC